MTGFVLGLAVAAGAGLLAWVGVRRITWEPWHPYQFALTGERLDEITYDIA